MPSMCLHLLISRKPIPLHEIPLKILANIASIHGQQVTHTKPKAKRAYTNFEGPFFPGFFGRERSQIFGPKREKGESCQTTQHTTDSNRICHNLSIFARFCQSLTCCGQCLGCCRPFACNGSEEDAWQRPLPKSELWQLFPVLTLRNQGRFVIHASVSLT
jgi:hypothetical protein